MSTIYLDCNLGLGDLIIANGMIRELSTLNSIVYVPCYAHNMSSVYSMFRDLKNVLLCLPEDKIEAPKLVVGCNHPQFYNISPSFDEAMYKLANVTFEKRWSSFKLPELAYSSAPPDRKYILIHEDKERGFVLDRDGVRTDLDILSVNRGVEPVSHWIPFIREAREVHCINSSLLHLVESVETKGSLYFHKYARPFTPFDLPVFKKKWNVLD